MIFAVIDTNVIVSALMAKDIQTSNPYKVVSFALTGVIVPICIKPTESPNVHS